MNRIPPVTLALLIAIVACFALQHMLSPLVFLPFELWPWGRYVLGVDGLGRAVTVGFMPWQLLTHGFLHQGLAHVAFNGWALYQFGSAAENVLGSRRFAFYYFFCLIGAALCQLAVDTAMLNPIHPVPTGAVGASGAIFGLLLAFAVFYPGGKIFFFVFPVAVPARIAVVIYGGVELYLGISGKQPNVGHFAHLGGLAFGWALIWYWRWRGEPPFARREPPELSR